MSEGRRGRRVRVITDEVKYRRHRRKKMARLVVRVLVWILVAVVAVALFWVILDKMMQPPPQE
jgi:hypothetical protein